MTIGAESSRLLKKEPCRQGLSVTVDPSILLMTCLLCSGLVSASPASSWRHPFAGKKRQRIIGLLELASIFRPDETYV
jgi:hypothetical protein